MIMWYLWYLIIWMKEMTPFVQSHKNFHSIHIIVRKTNGIFFLLVRLTFPGSSRSGLLWQGSASGAKSDSKASRAMPSAIATQTHSTEQEPSGSGDVGQVQPPALWWQARLQPWGARSTQVVLSTCQDHHSSSSATPELREEGDQIHTRLLTAHSYSLNINLIHGYTGMSYYS